ncbi:RPA-related protein RADX [Aplochiton taeniatus]
MAATGCALRRAFSRCPQPNGEHSVPDSSGLCREPLLLTSLQRYGKDLGFPVFFPRAIYAGESLYDATITDGNRRLRVTLDPGLNGLVERNYLRCGSLLRNVSLAPGVCVREGCGVDRGTYGGHRIESLEVVMEEGGVDGSSLRGVDAACLPWFGAGADVREMDPGPLMPLRADRALFLPLWNNTDPIGPAWRDTPPSPHGADAGAESEEMEEVRATVTLRKLQEAFLSGCHSIRSTVRKTLVVRIINKSNLMYYGKSDRNCECPYKASLQVCDGSAMVCVVLWNSVCADWYRSLRPGQILSLSHYRVKESYDSRTTHSHVTEIELSVNSRNPSAQIHILPESSVSPDCLPPKPDYSFYSGNDLLSCPHANLCDVIGLVMFAGRSERMRSKGVQGVELLEYRWLGLEDGTTDQPIMVKLFSTSQPETHRKTVPLCVLVCTRLKMVRGEGWYYLTNSNYTQVYCTGSGHHSKMHYKKLRPVRQFLQWMQSLDDRQVLSRAVIGGFFSYPPLPVSLETYMKNRKGEPGLLSGAELQREMERLHYRETHSYCIQATVSMVTHCRRGEEELSLFWTDRRTILSSSPQSSPSSSRLYCPRPLPPDTCRKTWTQSPPPLGLPLSPALSHPNTWSSILTHGAFSTHTPPPGPADLIATATQLANQRLVCVLEACHLGGNRTEIVLTRAYPLRD